MLHARLKTPAAANIVSVVRPFEDPTPPGMHDFDLVTFFYAYHDITYLGVDAVFAAIPVGVMRSIGVSLMSTSLSDPVETRHGLPGDPEDTHTR